jgi:hypothetical protein
MSSWPRLWCLEREEVSEVLWRAGARQMVVFKYFLFHRRRRSESLRAPRLQQTQGNEEIYIPIWMGPTSDCVTEGAIPRA